jgi:hypothetical protein
MTRRTKIRAAVAAWISTGGWLRRLTADFPALSRASFFFGRKDFEFSFGFDDRLRSGRIGFDRGRSGHRGDDSDRGSGSRLLGGDGRDGLLDVGWRFDDSGGSGLGSERVFVFGLVVNDLDRGRLISAARGVFVCGGGWGGRAGALAARQA